MLTFHPEGDIIAWGARNGMIHLCATQGTLLGLWGKLVGHVGVISRLDFSPDGKTLASSSYDGTVRIWDVTDRSIIRQIRPGRMGLYDVRYIANGEKIITGSWDNSVYVYDVETGDRLQRFRASPERLATLAVSPDERYVLDVSPDERYVTVGSSSQY